MGINWWKVLGVDCVGGMMGGPGGPGGYAGASAIAVIMQMDNGMFPDW